MIQRLLSSVLVLSFAATAAQAGLRSPQIPVTGTALQSFFTAHGQAIDVSKDQLDLQTLSLPAGASIQVDAAVVSDPSTNGFGAYNAGATSPALYQVFPGAAATGWFSVMAFRATPTRMVVNLFDASSALQGTNTYLGADPTNLGFYLQTSGGVFYSQDARNSGARLLAFSGTGADGGDTWLAWETGAGPGGDYADSIWLLPFAFGPVPVSHTNWGTVKARFR